jgi:Tripartite tricarboxylate transporter family receptor
MVGDQVEQEIGSNGGNAAVLQATGILGWMVEVAASAARAEAAISALTAARARDARSAAKAAACNVRKHVSREIQCTLRVVVYSILPPARPRCRPARASRGRNPTQPGPCIYGGQDIVARLMGQWLAVRLGRQFIIENRPGASGNLALEAVANAPPDGYTLALLGVNNAINAGLYNKPGFEFLRDIAPVGAVMRVPVVMVVNPSFPATTVPQFIAYAKANPGKITMGSGGVGVSQRRAEISETLYFAMRGS